MEFKKIKQICSNQYSTNTEEDVETDRLYALCEDGTVYYMKDPSYSGDPEWIQLPGIKMVYEKHNI